MQIQTIMLIASIIALIGTIWSKKMNIDYNEQKFQKWRVKWIIKHPQFYDEVRTKEMRLYGQLTAPLNPPELEIYLNSKKTEKNIAFIMSCAGLITTIFVGLFFTFN